MLISIMKNFYNFDIYEIIEIFMVLYRKTRLCFRLITILIEISLTNYTILT